MTEQEKKLFDDLKKALQDPSTFSELKKINDERTARNEVMRESLYGSKKETNKVDHRTRNSSHKQIALFVILVVGYICFGVFLKEAKSKDPSFNVMLFLLVVFTSFVVAGIIYSKAKK